MITLQCLQQEPERELWAGDIREIEGLPSQRAQLSRQFEVEGLGSFGRSLAVPMYSPRDMQELPDEELGFSKGAMSRIGFAADCGGEPIAYITATHGIYTYPLPVYAEESVPASYKPAGCLVAGGGFVTVLERGRRRGAAVAAAILLALLVFGFVGLYFACGGFGGIWQALKDIIKA